MKKRLVRLGLAFYGLCSIALVTPSMATRSFEPASPDTIPTIFDGLHWGQTFTVGVSGTLTSVQVLVAQLFNQQAEDLLVTIFNTSGGLPNNPVTPAIHLSPTIVPIVQHASDFTDYAYLSASFSLPVTTGNVLAIVLSTGDTSQYFWAGVLSGGYPRGQLFRNEGFVWTPEGVEDQVFRTFVEPKANVPELPSLLLFAFGFAALLRYRRSI